MAQTEEDTRHVTLKIGHVEKITTRHRYNHEQANEIVEIAMRVAEIGFKRRVSMTAGPVTVPEDR